MAALLGLSFFRVTHVERGYVVDRILTADVTLPGSRYQKDEQRALFHQRALEKLEALPGVRSAGLISSLPLKAQVWGDAINKEGDTRPRAERPLAHYRFVSEHYFETMGVALRQGRFPTARDRTHKVAVVSESAARKVWPGENPIGKLIRNDPKPEWVEVIGVVADVRTESLEKQPPMMVYVPYWDGAYWQGSVWGNATYVVRTSQDPATMANALRSAIHELDAGTAAGERAHDAGDRVGVGRQPKIPDITGRRLCGRGVAVGMPRDLRRDLIQRGAADERDRDSNCLGAQASQVSMLVLRQGIRPVIGGLLVGVAGCIGGGTADQQFPVRHGSARSGGDIGGGRDAACGRSRGVLGACAEGVPDRSCDCSAQRVMHTGSSR